MCLERIRKFQKKYKDRCRSFYSSTVAGLYTGVAIGILFTLIADSKFNRWINLLSYELFAAIVYFLFTIFMVFSLYLVGWICVHLFIASKISNENKKKQHLINFRINYVASLYSASWITSVILLWDKTSIIFWVSLFFILLYPVAAYIAVRNKKRKK